MDNLIQLNDHSRQEGQQYNPADMAHRESRNLEQIAQPGDKDAELTRQFCQKLALAQQTLAQPDLSGFHEMEEGLHRLEESFGEKPAAEKNEQ